jgi:hypothetical protein
LEKTNGHNPYAKPYLTYARDRRDSSRRPYEPGQPVLSAEAVRMVESGFSRGTKRRRA